MIPPCRDEVYGLAHHRGWPIKLDKMKGMNVLNLLKKCRALKRIISISSIMNTFIPSLRLGYVLFKLEVRHSPVGTGWGHHYLFQPYPGFITRFNQVYSNPYPGDIIKYFFKKSEIPTPSPQGGGES